MKTTREGILLLSCLLVTSFVEASWIDWVGPEGMYNASMNWTGGILPTAGDVGQFTQAGTSAYVVHFPEGGYVEKGIGTVVRNLGEGRSVTFDATGTYWYKDAGQYPNNWNVLFFGTTGGNWPHIFNLEADYSDASRNQTGVMKLEDGILTFTQRNSGSHLVLESGSFNVYDPDPARPNPYVLKLFKAGYAGDHNRMIVKDGASFRAGAVELYGGSGNDNFLLAEGGTLAFAKKLVLLEKGKLVLTNNAALTVNGTTLVGWDPAHQAGSLSLWGNSRMLQKERISLSGNSGDTTLPALEMGGAAVLSTEKIVDAGGKPQEGKRSQTRIRLSGDSQWNAGSYLNMGASENSDVDIALKDRAVWNSVLDNTDPFQLGKAPGSFVKVRLADQSQLHTKRELTLCNAGESKAELAVLGSSVVEIDDGHCYVGRRAMSQGTIRIADEGTFRMKGKEKGLFLSGSNGTYGDNRAAAAKLILEGGTLDLPDSRIGISGTNSCVLFKGGTASVQKLDLAADANTADIQVMNRFEISGGTHQVQQGINIGGNEANTHMEITGGELTVGAYLTVGLDTTGTGNADLKVAGGLLKITPHVISGVAQPSQLMIARDPMSAAKLSLMGGEIAADEVRGGAGTAALFADGGMLTLTRSDSNALGNFDTATLGEKGLTLNVPVDLSATSGQSFTDAESARGTVTKIGQGRLMIAEDSDHARTVLGGGALSADRDSFHFGRELVITNQATLDLGGTPTFFSVEKLVLGNAETQGVITMDPEDRISVTGAEGLTVEKGMILFTKPTQIGSYPLIETAVAPSAEMLKKLTVKNAKPGYAYTFTAPQQGNGYAVTLTISALELPDAVWSGAVSSAWSESGNWSGAQIPAETQVAVFPQDAPNHTVQVTPGAAAGSLSFAGEYLLSGSALQLRGGCTVNGGAVRLQQPITLEGSAPMHVGAASSLSLEGAVSTVGGVVLKDGTGALSISGANTAFDGKWVFQDGLTSVKNPQALGKENLSGESILLSGGTLSYEGPAGEISRGLSVKGANERTYAILHASSDVEFSGNFQTTSGNLIKRGQGEITLNFAGGNFPLGNGNIDTPTSGGSIVLPENGGSPLTALNSLGGLNVLEGTVRLQGAGIGKTVLSQQQAGLVGANWAQSQKDAVLDVNGVTLKQGGPRKALCIGYRLPAGVPNAPAIRVTNSEVFCNTLQFGPAGAAQSNPIFAITNGSLTAEWGVQFGDDSGKVRSSLRMGSGSTIVARHPNGNSGAGLFVAREVDALIADSAVLAARSVGGDVGVGLSYQPSAKGVFRFVRGGTLETYKFTSRNYAATADAHVDLVFDGGVLAMTASGVSTLAAAEYQGITTEGEGIEVRIPKDLSHTFTFPIRGTGPVVKSGAGELVFGEGMTALSAESIVPSGIPTAGHSGKTTVREGTLRVTRGGISATAEVEVCADAELVLDCAEGDSVEIAAVHGSGTVRSGALKGGLACRIPQGQEKLLDLNHVTIAPPFAVTFVTDLADTALRGMEIPVATFSGGSVMRCDQWKSRGLPEKLIATFEERGNTVYATIRLHGGTLLLLK